MNSDNAATLRPAVCGGKEFPQSPFKDKSMFGQKFFSCCCKNTNQCSSQMLSITEPPLKPRLWPLNYTTTCWDCLKGNCINPRVSFLALTLTHATSVPRDITSFFRLLCLAFLCTHVDVTRVPVRGGRVEEVTHEATRMTPGAQ